MSRNCKLRDTFRGAGIRKPDSCGGSTAMAHAMSTGEDNRVTNLRCLCEISRSVVVVVSLLWRVQT